MNRQFPDGPPLGKLAPSGGSALHAVKSVGATYIGRFAPSPTGPLHAGSLVAALASWLDARAHGGQWLVRIEDADTPRNIPGMAEHILGQLAAVGLLPDEPPLIQSQRSPVYQKALDDLAARGLAYPCTCSRKDVATALAVAGRVHQRQGELVYPGTCRASVLNPSPNRSTVQAGRETSTPPHTKKKTAWRLRTDIYRSKEVISHVLIQQFDINNVANSILQWHDRRLGPQQQNVEEAVGDFPLKRSDGCFTYQLAVVVDDAAQGISHVVRGEDLADNTARQILLQAALGLPTPIYLHTPLVMGANGQKLSKQNGARALDTSDPLAALGAAARCLGLQASSSSAANALRATDALSAWVAQWRQLYNLARE